MQPPLLSSTRAALLAAAGFLLGFAAPMRGADSPPAPVTESPAARQDRLRWYHEAKFGMFIHWGLYSIPAGIWRGQEVPGIGEWIMEHGKIPMKDYQPLAGQFNPVNFDADAWVRAAKDAGMKYIVITAKHHDGFAMFKSDASPFNIVDATPFKRDPLQELAAACRKAGIRLGFYYSQAQDWNHPGGAAWNGSWDPAQKGDMDEYLRTVAVPQVRELLTHYGPVSVFWWDTPKDMTPARAALLAPLLALQPGIISNNRLGGGYPGDTKTPEQRIPATGYPGDWETCMTMNDTWGYKSYDQDWKSATTLVRNLIDIVSKGGNYLLNVGPNSLGEFPGPSLERLQQIGAWLRQNGEAIYGTTASPFPRLTWGRATQKPGRLYLHVFDWPRDGTLTVPMRGGATRAYLLADPATSLPLALSPAGLVLSVPASAPDPIASVIVLEGVGPVQPLPVPPFQPAASFTGRWTLLPEKSSPIELYRTLALETSWEGNAVKILQTWGEGDQALRVPLKLTTDGDVSKVPVTNRVWPTNVFMGVSMDQATPERVSGAWFNDGRRLELDRRYSVKVSQGWSVLESRDAYEVSEAGDELTLTIDRPVRTGPPYKYVFKRAGTKEGYMMRLGDHWDVAGRLDENALLISLQGLANARGPRLYFLYPDNYDFRDATAIYDFYRSRLDYTFTELHGVEQALRTFLPAVKGYIVWDKQARVSLDVAFTVAGLEHGVVVSGDQVPLVGRLGLKPIADFRGRFEGKSDLEVFRWAYDQYGARCSRDTIVWMGGEAGPRMLPGIADYGIDQGAFFADLSTDPAKNPGEYALAKEILGRQKPFSIVVGWHSYGKDRERNYVTLASSFADRVEGLNTLPNLSFTSKTPPSPGFTFANHHHVVPGRIYRPEPKVYLSCIQTDGLGLGAWVRPGRGEIPYAWEVTINWLWMCPTLLQYYYESATPNDYFIGAITGPGYMYPKAIPPKLLPPVIALADRLCRQLDINVFETMDYSEGATVVGNTDLPKQVVDAYYQGMPEMLGFANGYAPAFTFAAHDGRPFVSFDYYLPEDRPEVEVARDLEELARINPRRPYFLLIHVREWSDISRVKSILDRLGPEFADVPLDVFMKLAGQDPTFQERYKP